MNTKRLFAPLAALVVLTALASPVCAVSANDILARVKATEAGVQDMRADMVIEEANKKNVSGMGEGYGDIVKLEKAVVSYRKPDKLRYDGYAKGIKVTYIQNGYTKLVIASMIRSKDNVKDSPGKRQDTLDMGFLSSRLWTDNKVTVESAGKDGTVKLKLDPKFGGADKRHDNVWINSKTLRLIKREKYLGSGELRVKYTYTDHALLAGKLPIATTSTMYDPQGKELGTVSYRNVKANVGLDADLFSLTQR